MNWYHFFKISMPVAVENGPYAVSEVIIWGIDEDFNWHEVAGRDESGFRNSHGDLPGYRWLASGRYEKNDIDNGVVSLSTSIPSLDILPQKKDYMMRRVEKMLDDRFNSPKILLM
jgi:hypothetical protein